MLFNKFKGILLPLYIFSYLFFSFRPNKYIEIAPSSVIIIFMGIMLLINYKNNKYLFKENLIAAILLLLFIIVNYINGITIFNSNSTYIAYLVSIITFIILRYYTRNSLDLKLLIMLLSMFLILSGILTTFQYFDIKYSWYTIFSLSFYDQRGAGFADTPQSNSGLCLWTFSVISTYYFIVHLKNRWLSLVLYLAIFFGAIAMLNVHSRAGILALGALNLIFIFIFLIRKQLFYKKIFIYFSILIMAYFSLFIFYSMNNVNYERISESLEYFKIGPSFLNKINSISSIASLKNSTYVKEPLNNSTHVKDSLKSINSRLHSNMFAVNLIKLNPLTGVGAGKFIDKYLNHKSNIGDEKFILDDAPTMAIHNHLLSMATEMGIPFLLILIILNVYTIRFSGLSLNSFIFLIPFICINIWLLFTASIHERLFWISFAMLIPVKRFAED